MAGEPEDSSIAESLQSTLDVLQGCLDHLRQVSGRLEPVRERGAEDLRQIRSLINQVSMRPAMADLAMGQVEHTAGAAGWEAKESDLRRQCEMIEAGVSRVEQLVSKLSLLTNQIEAGRAYLEGDESAHVGDPWEAALRARMIQGQEGERARLAREIHDGPAQVLANTIMGLDFCEELAKRGSPNVADELAKLRVTMREGLNELRHFIFNLRPSSLEELGLIGTLCRYIEDYEERFGIQVSLANAQLADRLPPEQEIVLFRVVQEALQNVRKHANASMVTVAFDRSDPHALNLTVTDNGSGFDFSRVLQRNGPLGLVSMRERAESIGGKVRIKSSPGRGTEVILSIPYNRS